MSDDGRRIIWLFALAGAAAAALFAMLFRSSGETYYGHTNIAESVPLAVAGGLAGGSLGVVLAQFSASRPRVGRWAVAVGVILLTALLGAAAGWLVGDLPARNWMEQRELTRQGVRTGAVVGSLVGLLVLAVHHWRR
jgi:hypothetical protein